MKRAQLLIKDYYTFILLMMLLGLVFICYVPFKILQGKGREEGVRRFVEVLERVGDWLE